MKIIDFHAHFELDLLDEKGTLHEVMIDNFDREEGSLKSFKIRNILAVSHSILQIFLRRLRKLLFY